MHSFGFIDFFLSSHLLVFIFAFYYHLLEHSLIYSWFIWWLIFIHWFVYAFVISFIYYHPNFSSPINSFLHPFIHIVILNSSTLKFITQALVYLLIHSSFHAFTYCSICKFIRWFINLLFDSWTNWFTHLTVSICPFESWLVH